MVRCKHMPSTWAIWLLLFFVPLIRTCRDADDVSSRSKSVLIIGAGPAGSSLAYFLSQRHANASITIIEKEGRVGGRVQEFTVYDAVSKRNYVVELGASIFLQDNAILYNASRSFGLLSMANAPETHDAMLHQGERAFAVYDGHKVVFSPSPRFFDIAMMWRYGLSLFYTRYLAKQALTHFSTIYNTLQGFTTPSQLTTFIKWNEYLTSSAKTFFSSHWISSLYSSEVIQGVARTNYAQNLQDLNVIAALCGVIPSPALKVPSGNAKIFQQMVAHSNADLHLNTAVRHIHLTQDRGGYMATTAKGSERFDIVVIAAPLSISSIQFDAPLKPPPQVFEYVHLHVTIVLGTVNASYFAVPLDTFPKVFLTLPSCKLFTAMSTLHRLHSRSESRVARWDGRGIFKIFSKEIIDEAGVAKLFSVRERVRRKAWYSYPYLVPRGPSDQQLPSFVLHEHSAGGLYYLSGFEGVMSSMESQSVAARNMANLLMSKWLGEQPSSR